MIIVEGCDGTGKSTLVKELLTKFGADFPLAAAGTRGPSEHVVERVHEAFGYEVKAGNRPVIYDRLYFSELVYGKILRGKVEFTQSQQRFILRLLKFLDTPIIICDPGQQAIMENILNSDQMEGVREAAENIYLEYQEYADLLIAGSFNFINYNYQVGITSYMHEQIFRYLTERKHRSWNPVISPPGMYEARKIMKFKKDPEESQR